MNAKVKAVIDHLLAEAAKLMKDCPTEVSRLYKYSIVPSNMGGLWDQSFTIMVFAEGDIRQMSAYQMFMLCRLVDRPEFDVDQLKILFKETVPLSAEFVMTCGFESIWDNVKKVLAVLDLVQTKEEMKELLEAINALICNYHNWVHFMFPWKIGELYRLIRKEDVAEMADLVNLQLK